MWTCNSITCDQAPFFQVKVGSAEEERKKVISQIYSLDDQSSSTLD